MRLGFRVYGRWLSKNACFRGCNCKKSVKEERFTSSSIDENDVTIGYDMQTVKSGVIEVQREFTLAQHSTVVNEAWNKRNHPLGFLLRVRRSPCGPINFSQVSPGWWLNQVF